MQNHHGGAESDQPPQAVCQDRARRRTADARMQDQDEARVHDREQRRMPLIAGPTWPDSVTTVATSVATKAARSGMSYQRRVINGILAPRKRCASGRLTASATTFAVDLMEALFARVFTDSIRWHDALPLRVSTNLLKASFGF